MGLKDLSGLKWRTLEEIYRDAPEVDADQELRRRYPGFQGNWCKFIMAYTSLEMVQDTVVLVHAPLNCTSCVRTFKEYLYHQGGAPFVHSPCTAMDQNMVIFGAEGELRQAIVAVDRDYRPRLIVVLAGCAPGLTLDDMTAVVEKVRPLVQAKLLLIHSYGFEAVYMGRAIEEHIPSWAEIMDPPERVDPEAVNILGNEKEVGHFCARAGAHGPRQARFNHMSDSAELARYIEGLGLKVHRVLMSGDYDYVRTAPEAAVNTLNCGTHAYPLALAMKEKFRTPFLRHELPLGVESTSKWIRDLASFMSRQEEGETLIQGEYQTIAPVWEACLEMVRDKVALVGGSFNRGSSYGRMCRELGMEVYHFGSAPPDIKAKHHDVEYYLSEGYNPLHLCLDDGMWWQNISAKSVMDSLGLDRDQVVYLITDFPPDAKAGEFDPSDTARLDSSVHLRRHRGYPGRSVGFKGAQGLCLEIMEAIKAARRKSSPTLYGRLYGRPFNFEEAPRPVGALSQ